MVGSMWGGWNNWQLSWNRNTLENTVSLNIQSPSLADFYSFELFSCIPLLVSVLFSFRFRWLSTWFHVYLLDWKYNKYLSFRMNTFCGPRMANQNEPTLYTIILVESRKIHVFGLFLAQPMNRNHDDFARIDRKHEYEWRDECWIM